MSAPLTEALIDGLILWARTGASMPVEISLKRDAFLALAGELKVHDAKGRWQAVWIPGPPPTWIWPPDPGDDVGHVQQICVGPAFEFASPGGMVRIREATE